MVRELCPQICHQAAYITEIKTAHGIITDQLTINNQSKRFFKSFIPQRTMIKTEISCFFDKLEFPSISEQEEENLDRPISVKRN